MGNKLKRQQKIAAAANTNTNDGTAQGVIGMLFIVDVRMVIKRSGKKIKKKLLIVGCESTVRCA